MTVNLSDRAVSLIRTLVPKAWGLVVGALLAWLALHAPWAINVLDSLGIDLNGAGVVVTVIALTEAGWYWVWRWAEPRIPAWLATVVLGSAKTPTYAQTVNPADLDAAYRVYSTTTAVDSEALAAQIQARINRSASH